MRTYSDYQIIDNLIYVKPNQSFARKFFVVLAELINSRTHSFHLQVNQMLNTFMMTHEALLNISFLLTQVIKQNIPGEIIEIGCHEGTTAILLRSVINRLNVPKKLILYDAFEGLQHFSEEDALLNLQPGDLKTDVSILKNNFQKFGFKLPKVVIGTVEETIPKALPTQIAFAHVDLDLYSPTVHALKWIIPRLVKGAIVVLDDYGHPRIPGIQKAVEDSLRELKLQKSIHILYGGIHPPLTIWPRFRGERVRQKYQAYIET